MLSKQKSAFLVSLADEEGCIEPAAVVEAARDPSSPLHDEFIWDNAKAAAEHRLDTARSLIRIVRFEVTIEDRVVVAPMYVSDPTRPPKSKRYVELTRAGRDKEIAERIVLDELDRIANSIRRAQSVAAVLGLSPQLESMLFNVVELRTKAERRAVMQRASGARRRGAIAKRKAPARGGKRQGRRDQR